MEPLTKTLLQDSGGEVCEAAAQALGKIGDSRAVKALAVGMDQLDKRGYRAAAQALARIGGAQAVDVLDAALNSTAKDKRDAAMAAIAFLQEPELACAPANPTGTGSVAEAKTTEKRLATPPAAVGARKGAASSRVIRVFISSTFRDMREDRNLLMSKVWPELRRLCREREVEFVEVDLRWGITEEQSERKETVRYCLAEIKRCRPYFIGLLGERYGWIPGAEAYPEALLKEEAWLEQEIAHRSVTALEIQQGVLNDPDMAGRAFFYFRDPAYVQERGADYQAENATAAAQQAALKEDIRRVCRAKQIPLREGDRYQDPEHLAEQVLADLTAVINAEFPADQVPDRWSREEAIQKAYAQSRRTKYYVGRATYFQQLNAYARAGAAGCGLCVTGESGGGKSALLANWLEQWQKNHPDDFVFQHYVGSSALSSDHNGLMRRLMVAILRWCGGEQVRAEEEAVLAQTEELLRVFPRYLDRLAKRVSASGVRAVLVTDALSQLTQGGSLTWLPERLPEGLRWIVSSLPGETLAAIQEKNWLMLRVEPLTLTEREQLIVRYLANFSQGLSKVRVQKIAESQASSGPLYLKTLLEDLRVIGSHEELDKQIDAYIQAKDIPGLLTQILARYEREYEEDRPQLVRDALGLLWAARRGLSEPELLQALGGMKGKSLPAARWSPLRYALDEGLIERDGLLTFGHEHLREAVRRSYVVEESAARAYRLRLADSLAERKVDARQADELPWLLRQAGERERLRESLLDIERFYLMEERDEIELRGYWIWLEQEREMGKAYLARYMVWEKEHGGDSERISLYCYSLGVYLRNAACYAETESLLRRALAINEASYGPDAPEVAKSLNALAGLLSVTNRHAEAEPLYRRALAINEASYGPDAPEVAKSLNDLGTLMYMTNRHAEAEPLYRRALAIDEASYGENHPAVVAGLTNLVTLLLVTKRYDEAEPLCRRALAIQKASKEPDGLDTAVGLLNMGNLLSVTNRYAEVEPLFRRVLAILEGCYGEKHPLVAAALGRLAVLLQDTNHPAEAEPLYRRALAIDEARYGPDAPEVAKSLNDLAGLLSVTKRYTEAEPLYRRALAINEASYGPDAPEVAKSLNDLAGLLSVTKRYTEAEPLFRRALAIDETHYGADAPEVATSLDNLVDLLVAMNRYDEAAELMKRASEISDPS